MTHVAMCVEVFFQYALGLARRWGSCLITGGGPALGNAARVTSCLGSLMPRVCVCVLVDGSQLLLGLPLQLMLSNAPLPPPCLPPSLPPSR